MITDAEKFSSQTPEATDTEAKFKDLQKQLDDMTEWVGKHRHTLTDKTQPLPQQAIPTTTRTQYVIFTSTTKNLTDASTSVQYAHGFGDTPRYITMQIFAASASHSYGVYTQTPTTSYCIGEANAGGNAVFSSSTDIGQVWDSNAMTAGQTVTVGTDSTNITVTWTKVSVPAAGAIKMILTAEY